MCFRSLGNGKLSCANICSVGQTRSVRFSSVLKDCSLANVFNDHVNFTASSALDDRSEKEEKNLAERSLRAPKRNFPIGGLQLGRRSLSECATVNFLSLAICLWTASHSTNWISSFRQSTPSKRPFESRLTQLTVSPSFNDV